MLEQEVISAIKYMQKYQTETDKIEAKTAEIDFPKKCYDTISGFANKYGGIIIFGINEHNSFIEQDVYDVNDLQKQITSLCSDSMEPIIRPEFLPITYNGKTLLAVKINEIPQNSTGEIYPTLAGTLLFAEYPQAYLPQLVVACVVVPGTKWGDIGEMGQRFDDNKKIEGTLDEMLEQTLSFIRKNIGTKIIIDNNGKRENLPEYPMKALREAVANALVHRLSEASDNLCYAK